MDERDYFLSKVPGRTYVSKRFNTAEGSMRYVSRIIDGDSGYKFVDLVDEITIRKTPAGRREIKAAILEDERAMKTLTIQEFRNGEIALERQYFTFVHEEIDTVVKFFASLKTMDLGDPNKARFSESDIQNILLSESSARLLLNKNEDLLVEAAKNAELKKDLIALGYRRSQLKRFEKLLGESGFFANEISRLGCKPEHLWQEFFEANTWIFGYGLSYQFTSSLSERKLQQVVGGHSVSGKGKVVDGLLKTQAHIKSLCFVEIKRHDTNLLGSEYRGGAFPPSKELCGGVAQIQSTVHLAMENIGRKLEPQSADGTPTGEQLFNIEPRSFLIVGNLNEFQTESGPNQSKIKSFELYRRNVHQPEIFTFDELLFRANFIVDSSVIEESVAAEDDVPF